MTRREVSAYAVNVMADLSPIVEVHRSSYDENVCELQANYRVTRNSIWGNSPLVLSATGNLQRCREQSSDKACTVRKHLRVWWSRRLTMALDSVAPLLKG